MGAFAVWEEKMSLKAQPIPPIPEDTRQACQGLLEPNDLYRIIAERLGDFVRDEDFADLYPAEGRPALSPALLAMATVLQFLENLSDRMAAMMVRLRMDWKLVLHLPLGHPGFDPSDLCEFRKRLDEHEASARVFDLLLGKLRAQGLLGSGGVQRTDSLAVLTAARNLTRLELVMETLRLALMALQKVGPGWLVAHAPTQWAERYGQWSQQERLVREKGERGRAEVLRLAQQTGQDGARLLADLAGAPEQLRSLPAVEVLGRVWRQQYEQTPEGLRLRERVQEDMGELIQTPHDPDARYTKRKSGKEHTGYLMHLTETVEEDKPRLITDVQDTPASEPDVTALEGVQRSLAHRGLLPGVHLVDTGYVSGGNIAQSERRGVELVGPIQADSSPQARLQEGLPLERFAVDYAAQQVRCPHGAVSVVWSEVPQPSGPPEVQVVFDARDCGACPHYRQCVFSGKETPQGRRLRLGAYHLQVSRRRREQQTAAFAERYRSRAGIEATMSEVVRAHGARVARYAGLGKVHLQHLMLATAANLKRAARWLAGLDRVVERPNRLRKLAALGAVRAC